MSEEQLSKTQLYALIQDWRTTVIQAGGKSAQEVDTWTVQALHDYYVFVSGVAVPLSWTDLLMIVLPIGTGMLLGKLIVGELIPFLVANKMTMATVATLLTTTALRSFVRYGVKDAMSYAGGIGMGDVVDYSVKAVPSVAEESSKTQPKQNSAPRSVYDIPSPIGYSGENAFVYVYEGDSQSSRDGDGSPPEMAAVQGFPEPYRVGGAKHMAYGQYGYRPRKWITVPAGTPGAFPSKINPGQWIMRARY